MVVKKPKAPRKKTTWPYTPEPSPRLSPVTIVANLDDNFSMSDSVASRTRPISVASPRGGLLSPGARPTLDDVLNGRAPQPYTLSAFTAFLSEQHCLETLEFTVEAKKYQEKYDDAGAHLAGMPLNVESDEGFELQQDWLRILDVYVKPGAPREINLPAEERDDMVDLPYGSKPPPPEALHPAVKRMNDLMSDSIFIPFCNSLRAVSHAQTYDALSEYAERPQNPEFMSSTFDDRRHERQTSQRRRHSPSSSTSFQPSRSPPSQHLPPKSSNLTSGLNRPTSKTISQYRSNTSVISAGESAVTDDSASGDSPMPSERDMLSPPVTPPAGEIGSQSSSKQYLTSTAPRPQRSESGGWAKGMRQKIWGNKKKPGSSSMSRDRDEI